MVYLCTPSMLEADTFRLSIFTCLRVKTAVIWLRIPAIFSEYTNNVYNVNLSDNLEYQEILSKYTSKVSQYTDIVHNN